MKPNVDGFVAIVRGLREGSELLEKLRIEKIRNSSIIRDASTFDDAFASAKFLNSKKPLTGLIRFRELLTRMNR